MKMQKKVRKEELKKKAESIKELVNDILNEKIDLPDKALIVDFDATLNIFTKNSNWKYNRNLTFVKKGERSKKKRRIMTCKMKIQIRMFYR